MQWYRQVNILWFNTFYETNLKKVDFHLVGFPYNKFCAVEGKVIVLDDDVLPLCCIHKIKDGWTIVHVRNMLAMEWVDSLNYPILNKFLKIIFCNKVKKIFYDDVFTINSTDFTKKIYFFEVFSSNRQKDSSLHEYSYMHLLLGFF